MNISAESIHGIWGKRGWCLNYLYILSRQRFATNPPVLTEWGLKQINGQRIIKTNGMHFDSINQMKFCADLIILLYFDMFIFTGLVNLNNTCFANAVLQCLRASPAVTSALKNLHHDFCKHHMFSQIKFNAPDLTYRFFKKCNIQTHIMYWSLKRFLRNCPLVNANN